MERRLIFLDIDGTLIPGLDPPSPLARKAVQGARAKGHLVFLCTGRNPPIILPEIRNIGFDGIIAGAGAYVEAGDEVLLEEMVPDEVVRECLSVFCENGFYCRIEGKEGIYMDPPTEALLRNPSPDPADAELLRVEREVMDHLTVRPYREYPGDGAYKMCFNARTLDSLDRVRAALEDRFTFVIQGGLWGGNCPMGEIIPRNVDKGKGMERICRHFGADLADTIAFGDSMNDEPILRRAGLSVAMGNACQELKDLADAVCEDVTRDGVYHELRRRGLC